jgi:uncharacterized membrane protein YtjA (UPF0391 family)
MIRLSRELYELFSSVSLCSDDSSLRGVALALIGWSRYSRYTKDGSFGPSATNGGIMLYYAAVFFVIAIIAGVLGFGGIAAGAASIAKILFFIFLVLALLAILGGAFRKR